MWTAWAAGCGCGCLVKGEGIVSCDIFAGDTGMEYLCDGIYKGKAIVYTRCFTRKNHLPPFLLPFLPPHRSKTTSRVRTHINPLARVARAACAQRGRRRCCCWG